MIWGYMSKSKWAKKMQGEILILNKSLCKPSPFIFRKNIFGIPIEQLLCYTLKYQAIVAASVSFYYRKNKLPCMEEVAQSIPAQ